MLDRILSLFKKNGKVVPKNKSILIIEDDLTTQKFLQATLEKDGYTVTVASTGKAGLERLERHKPHLILLDGLLPDLHGTKICKRIKSHEETRRIPVIFLTGLGSSANIVDCYDAGADQYLRKPIKARTLLKQISEEIRAAK